ncbi:hypothetical protein B0H13DRAFT_2684089 [Mycena leptocephala]|nr:hypothetical protein B0H13DRAFT_2684089 [Mycena leptocephala]
MLLHSRARLLPRFRGAILAGEVLQAPHALNVQAMLEKPVYLFPLSSPAPSDSDMTTLSMYTHGANICDMTSLSRLSAHKISASRFLMSAYHHREIGIFDVDVDPDAKPGCRILFSRHAVGSDSSVICYHYPEIVNESKQCNDSDGA